MRAIPRWLRNLFGLGCKRTPVRKKSSSIRLRVEDLEDRRLLSHGLHIEPVSNVPLLHSNPSLRPAAVIYLDFTGNFEACADEEEFGFGDFAGPTPFADGGWEDVQTPPFQFDGDATPMFTANEQAIIRSVHQQVAAHFSPFNIDVTTEYPGGDSDYFDDEHRGIDTRGLRVAIGGATTDWDHGGGTSALGVAILDAFNNRDENEYTNIAFVFSNSIVAGLAVSDRTTANVARVVANSVSHEAAHTFGLEHQAGNANTAIMSPQAADLNERKWVQGTNANGVFQNDIQVIGSQENGFGLRRVRTLVSSTNTGYSLLAGGYLISEAGTAMSLLESGVRTYALADNGALYALRQDGDLVRFVNGNREVIDQRVQAFSVSGAEQLWYSRDDAGIGRTLVLRSQASGSNLVLFDHDGGVEVTAAGGQSAFFPGVQQVSFLGSEASDRLAVSAGFSVAITADGRGGADYLQGGSAANVLRGQSGNDTLVGGAGADDLDGANDDDSLLGGAGNDTLLGGNGRDTLDGEGGNDLLTASSGNDLLSGDAGEDTLHGDAGEDTLSGGTGSDHLYGGEGRDTILFRLTTDAGPGIDHIEGGLNSDIIVAEGTAGADDIRLTPLPGVRNYQISLNGMRGDVFGPGRTIQREYGAIQFQMPTDVEVFRIDAGAGWDRVAVDASFVDRLQIEGGDGDDVLSGASGTNALWGGSGNDTLVGGPANDELHGGDGNDVLLGAGGSDALFSEGQDDVLIGGAGTDFLYGGAGSDLIFGDHFHDASHWTNPVPTSIASLLTSLATSLVSFDAINQDELAGDVVFADDERTGDVGGDDIVFGSNGQDVLFGGGGNDWVDGRDGTDVIDGGAGNDTLYGGRGFDRVFGGSGQDTIFANTSQTRAADPTTARDPAVLIVELTSRSIQLYYEWFARRYLDALLNPTPDAGDREIVRLAQQDGQLSGETMDTLIARFGDDRLRLKQAMVTLLDQNVAVDEAKLRAMTDEIAKQNAEIIKLGGQPVSTSTIDFEVLLGEAGNDEIHGGASKDVIDAGAGSDTIHHSAGSDVIFGGTDPSTNVSRYVDPSTDTYVVQGTENADVITVSSIAGRAVYVAFGSGQQTSSMIGLNAVQVDHLGIERVKVEALGGDDIVTVATQADAYLEVEVDGGAGRDLLNAGGGLPDRDGNREVLNPAIGEQWRVPGYANYGELWVPVHGGLMQIKDLAAAQTKTTLIGGLDQDMMFAGRGESILYGGTAPVPGRSYDDVDQDTAGELLFGGEGADLIHGGRGNDVIYGLQANDTLYGNQGNDTIAGQTGADYLYGGAGDDILGGGGEDDWMYGDDGNDDLTGAAGNDYLSGGNGNDWLSGDGAANIGRDTVVGGLDHDTYDEPFGTYDNLESAVLRCAAGGRVIDAEGSHVNENGCKVLLNADNGGAWHQWKFEYQGNGEYWIVNSDSLKVLDADPRHPSPYGSQLKLWDRQTDNKYQLWQIYSLGGGYYRFLNSGAHSDNNPRWLEVAAGQTNGDGGQVRLADWVGTDNQRFKLDDPQAATTSELTSSAVTPVTQSQTITLTATVRRTDSGAALSSGSVTFLAGTTVLGTATLNANGQATLTTSGLARGTHSIQAVFSRAPLYAESTSAALTQIILWEPHTVLSSSATGPVNEGEAITFTAAVALPNGGSTIPVGAVTFLDGSTVLGTIALDAAGQAALTTSRLAAGTYSIRAVFHGTAEYAVSTSATLNQTILLQSHTVLSSSATGTVLAGQAVTFTAKVSIPSGVSTLLRGTVTFISGSTVLGTIAVDATGLATLSTSNLAVGNHTIQAVFSSPANYTGSSSAASNQTVVPAPTTTSSTSGSSIGNDASPATTAINRRGKPGRGKPGRGKPGRRGPRRGR